MSPGGAATALRPALPIDGLNPRQAARRQRIVEAAVAMLDTRRHEQVQVKEVAAQASVALATLYHYFPSKERLLGAVLVEHAGQLRQSITRRPLRGGPSARLSEAYHRTIRAFERRPQLAQLVAHLEMSDDPHLAEVLRQVGEATDAVYRGALAGLEGTAPDRIVPVVGAVLDCGLRAWSKGRLAIDQVYRRVDDVIDLVLPAPTTSVHRS